MAAAITILDPCGPGQSVRERELQSASIRSHAARVSSAQAEVTKWAKRTTRPSWTRDLASWSERQRRLQKSIGVSPVDTKGERQDDSSVMSVYPSPQTFLGQGQVDPFSRDDLQKLPSIARECLEYSFMTLWPKNSPGLAKSTLYNHIIQCRRLAVHSPLEFHTQVSVAMSACYSSSKDPQVSKTLLLTRLKHQTAALSILRASIASLTGPPSDELIDCLSRVAATGGDLSSAGFVSGYRQTPMADALPIRGFGSFEPCTLHYDALAFLVRQRGTLEAIAPVVSHTLSLADTMLATKLGTRPTFPLHNDLRHISDRCQFDFDHQAVQLCTAMGSGWQLMSESHPKLVDLALKAVELTLALDQSHRAGRNCLPFPKLSLLATVFQHDLYDLGLGAESPSPVAANLHCMFYIGRLGLQIYSDFVLFPAPESSEVRQRLAAQLIRPLMLHESRKRAGAVNASYDLIRWATVMGAVASEGTSHRSWYLRQLKNFMLDDRLTWKDLKSSLVSFLWWDYVFDEHVLDIWDDALASTGAEKAFAAVIPVDISQCT